MNRITDIKQKKCSRCDKKRPIALFSKLKAGKAGINPMCKLCQKKSNKNYYDKHREKLLIKLKIYRKKHKKRLLELNKQYRERNAERIKEYKKNYLYTKHLSKSSNSTKHQRKLNY